jgi:hypothetical protein
MGHTVQYNIYIVTCAVAAPLTVATSGAEVEFGLVGKKYLIFAGRSRRRKKIEGKKDGSCRFPTQLRIFSRFPSQPKIRQRLVN